MLHGFVHDLIYGVRSLRRARGFTIVAVATLGLAVGANSAIFSFVDGVLLAPLPYDRPERLVSVDERQPNGQPNGAISTDNFLDWQRSGTVFEALAAMGSAQTTLSGGADPVLVRSARVSASYFDVFRMNAALGRTFREDEDQPGRDRVVVLSHVLWLDQFGGDPAIVGRTIVLDRVPYTVVGVMPADSPFDRGTAQLWRPLVFRASELTRNVHWLQATGRLKPGVSLEQARAEMATIGARIARDHPESNRNWSVAVDPLAETIVGSQLQRSLYVLLAAVGMLLLIGCANVANLTLARGTAREREVAVRAALGAGSGRLVRQFLAESLLLAVAGGVVGVAVGYGGVAALKLLIPPYTLPRDVRVAMDARVLLFTLGVSILTGVLTGLAPAVHASAADLAGAIKEGGRGTSGDGGRRRVRSALVIGEIALAFVLLVGSGLLVRSFFALTRQPLGFDATNILTLRLPIAGDRFANTTGLLNFVHAAVARVSTAPGVRGVAAADSVPLRGWSFGMGFLIASGEPRDRANRDAAGFKMVQPAYFRVLGIHILRGRALEEGDVAGAAPVAVVNETFVRRYFGDRNPIGERLLVQQIVPGSPQLGADIPWQIVGVMADEKTSSIEGVTRPGIYVPLDQHPTIFISLVIRSAVDAETLTRAVAQRIHEIDPQQAIADVRTLERIKDESAASARLRTLLLVVFAVLAVVLSAIGVYGVLAYTVAQRSHEIGVRAALGASSTALTRMVLANGLALTAAGLVLGLLGAFALTRVLANLLVGVGARDPLTLGAAALTLFAVALVACYVPARRAARLDPLVVLRDP